MGLVKGSAGWVTFRLKGLDEEDWREVVQDEISRRRHVENLFSRTKDANVGWASALDPGRTRITPMDYLLDNLIVLGMRIDVKKVNAKMLGVLVEKKVQETKEARGVERINAKWRKEIKEALEEELLYHQTPGLKLIEMAWRHSKLADGQERVFAFCTSNSVLQMLQDLFKDTFRERYGLMLFPDRPVDWLLASPDWDESSLISAGVRIWGDGYQTGLETDGWRHKDILHGRYAELTSDFMTWLWCQIDTANGTYTPDSGPLKGCEFWLESKVSMFDDGQKITMTGEHASQSAEAMAALAQGRTPIELQIGMRRHDEETIFTLKHADQIVRITGAKLNFKGTIADDAMGTITLRMDEVEELQSIVEQLFCTFFAERAAPNDRYRKRMEQWIGNFSESGVYRQGASRPKDQDDPRQVTLSDSIARAAANATANVEDSLDGDGIRLTLGDGTEGRLRRLSKSEVQGLRKKLEESLPESSPSDDSA